MNPTDWQYTHLTRQWESLDPRQRTDSREKKGSVPYRGYSSNNDNRLNVMKGTNAEMEHHNPSSHRSYRLNSNNFSPEKVTDPDGDPMELSKEDKELARKRRELQLIQEQISLKKATIAMKTTEPFLKAETKSYQMFKEEREEDLSRSKVDNYVRNTQPFMSTREKDEVDNYVRNTQPCISTREKDVDFSCGTGKWSSAYNKRPLKERVNVILQRLWPDGFLAKAFSTTPDHLPSPNPVEKTFNKDNHPLKLRVKALMNRHRNPGELDSHEEVPVVKPHPPSQSPSTTADGNDLVVKGLQRFISLLNKGVDIEMLTKIVNDDKELPLTGQDLLHSQTPVVKENVDVCKSDSQQLQFGAGQRDCWPSNEERKTELLNQHISHGGGNRSIQHEEKSAQSDDGGDRHFVSCHRSRSPPVIEENKPKLEQHQERNPSVSEQNANVCKGDSQQLQIGAGQRDRQSCSEEKTELLNQGISHGGSKRNVRPEVKFSHGNDGCGRHVESSRKGEKRSRSPSVDEKKPKLEQRQGQLQYILNSIGLSLEANDLCKLSERTQERLHDQKDDTSTGVSERRRQHLSHHSKSSSSDSPCSSPSRRQHSSSKTPRDSREQTQSSRHRHSRKRSKERVRERERDSDRGNNRIDSRDRSRDQRPSPEKPEYHVPYPDAATVTPTTSISDPLATYTSVQPSEYTAYHSNYSNGASSTAWNYGSNVIPPYAPYYPPGYFYYPVNPLCPPNTGALLGPVYPHPHLPAGFNDLSYLFNADLSQSEGQTGQQSGPRYLQAVDTATSSDIDRCLLQLTNGSKSRNSRAKARVKRQEEYEKRKEQEKIAKIQAQSVNPHRNANNLIHPPVEVDGPVKVDVLDPVPPVQASTEAQQLEKALPTEDEIKANLKKKLAAFNEKMKQQVPKPTETQPNVNDW